MHVPRALCTLVLVAALSGCLAGPDALPLTARQETRLAPESAEFPGLLVQGTLRVTDAGVVVQATASNQGNRTYQVETGCGTPWEALLFRGEDRLDLHEPRARCLAFSLTEFEPATQLNFSATWDGTMWDERSGRQIAAPAGDYDFSIRFVAYQQERIKRADLDFPVTVG